MCKVNGEYAFMVSRRAELRGRPLGIAAMALILASAPSAWSINPRPEICRIKDREACLFSDVLTRVHLAGKWFVAPETQPGPAVQRLGLGRLTLRSIAFFGPGAPPVRWSGHIACTPRAHSPASTCPGRTGDLRNITFAEHGTTGRDSLIRDFDADATFETGVSCHLTGVTIGYGVPALSCFVDCPATDSTPTLHAQFIPVRQGLPVSRDTNQ